MVNSNRKGMCGGEPGGMGAHWLRIGEEGFLRSQVGVGNQGGKKMFSGAMML